MATRGGVLWGETDVGLAVTTKLARDRGQGGVLTAPSAYFMKHPPRQFPDDEAYAMTEAFIAGERDA